jgi:hypothetical protein
MHVMYGSTGLAWIEKKCDLPDGHALHATDVVQERHFNLLYKVLRRLGLYRPYQHRRDGSDFLLK